MNEPSPLEAQLYCERCCGSNFLESFLSTNLPSIEIAATYGFKHWLSDEFLRQETFPETMPFLVLIRSPFDWIRSIYRNPWHATPTLKNMDFSDFIRAEWHCIWDGDARIDETDRRWMREMEFERNPLNRFKRFPNILEVRTVKYRLWNERLAGHPLYFRLALESLEFNPIAFLKDFSEKTGLPVPEETVVPEGYKGHLSWKRKLLHFATHGLMGGYSKAPRQPLEHRDIDFIHDRLDRNQEHSWGYDLDELAESEHQFTRSCKIAS